MTDMEKTLHEHGYRLENAEKRLGEHDKLLQQFTSIVIDIHDLVCAVKSIQAEQIAQGKRIAKIEGEPLDNLKAMKRTAFTTIAGTIAGAVGMGIVWLISAGLGGF